MLKLPFLKKTKNGPSKFLTLEINSCEIKCLVFYKENDAFKIIGSGAVQTEPGLIRNGIISDLESVANLTRETIEKATSDIEEDVEDVRTSIAWMGRVKIDSVEDFDFLDFQTTFFNDPDSPKGYVRGILKEENK